MSDYLLETGAVLTLAFVSILLDAVIVLLAVVMVGWPILILIPVVAIFQFFIWRLWMTRPSVQP